MATKQITTWAEFKTAAAETITEATTYEIMNNIDLSGELLDTTLEIKPGNFRKTFRPPSGTEYIAINGITSYGTNNIFKINKNTEFYNIRFTNMMLQSATLLYLDISTVNSMPITFNSCFFNGLVNSFVGRFGSPESSPRNHLFEKCSFNLSLGAGYIGEYYQTFNNCYFVVKSFYTGSNSNYRTTVFNSSNCTNCYFGGKLECGNRDNRLFAFNTFHSFRNNVINIDFDTTATPSTTIQCPTGGSTSGDDTSLLNQSKITKNENQTISDIAVKQVTDEQLKSYTYLKQNTDFPIFM